EGRRARPRRGAPRWTARSWRTISWSVARPPCLRRRGRSGPGAARCRAPRERARTPTRAERERRGSRELSSPLVDREVVGRLVGAGALLADLHEHVVEQRRRAEPEEVGRHPVAPKRL